MTVQVNGQELTLSGTVGADWFDESFTHAEVVAALARLDGDIVVRLNSGGGIAAEGAAIHSALATYDGAVSIVIEGIAASAASLLAMAGDTITMADGAVMMIHDPMNITIGNSEDHAKTIEELEAYARAYAKIYAKRSGKTIDECREIMKAETWFDGTAAIEAGFADEPGKAKAKPVAAYDYRAYARAPKRFVAQAKAKNWSLADHISTSAALSAVNDQESEMTEKERADALAAELATLKAEKAAAEAKLAELDADKAKAVADALKADRERRAAIMSLDEAKGREALAEALFSDGADAEKAKALLAVAPVATASADDAAAAYEANRLAGATLNGGKQGGDAQPVWAKAVARANKFSKM